MAISKQWPQALNLVCDMAAPWMTVCRQSGYNVSLLCED